MAHSGLTRRALLVWSLLLGIGLPLARKRSLTDAATRAALSDVFSDPESAAIVGAEYLRTRPQERDERFLSGALGLTDGWLGGVHPGDLASLRREVLHRHRLDFQNGATVDFHGWILSATELRLCALVHLGARA